MKFLPYCMKLNSHIHAHFGQKMYFPKVTISRTTVCSACASIFWGLYCQLQKNSCELLKLISNYSWFIAACWTDLSSYCLPFSSQVLADSVRTPLSQEKRSCPVDTQRLVLHSSLGPLRVWSGQPPLTSNRLNRYLSQIDLWNRNVNTYDGRCRDAYTHPMHAHKGLQKNQGLNIFKVLLKYLQY